MQAQVGLQRHHFADLRALLACASPARSGDELAGLAAQSAQQRVAAREVLADLPLRHFLQEAVVPYEADEISRLILDSHDASAFAPVGHLTVGGLSRLAVVRRRRHGDPASALTRPHARDGGGGE